MSMVIDQPIELGTTMNKYNFIVIFNFFTYLMVQPVLQFRLNIFFTHLFNTLHILTELVAIRLSGKQKGVIV